MWASSNGSDPAYDAMLRPAQVLGTAITLPLEKDIRFPSRQLQELTTDSDSDSGRDLHPGS